MISGPNVMVLPVARIGDSESVSIGPIKDTFTSSRCGKLRECDSLVGMLFGVWGLSGGLFLRCGCSGTANLFLPAALWPLPTPESDCSDLLSFSWAINQAGAAVRTSAMITIASPNVFDFLYRSWARSRGRFFPLRLDPLKSRPIRTISR
jgi:hypothetical protein